MLTKDEIIAVLASVAGPDGTTSLPGSGALSDIVISDGRVAFSITGDPARSAELEGVRLAAERAVKGLEGVKTVLVTLTAERPAQSAPPSARPSGQPARVRAGPTQARTPIVGVGRVIAVASGKGGVGKSTTAANLALALAAEGLRVGILDADIYGPSMPRLFGFKGKPEVTEARVIRPLGGSRPQDHVDGLPRLRGDRDGLARADGRGRGRSNCCARSPGSRSTCSWSTCRRAPATRSSRSPNRSTLAGAVIVSTPQDLALIDARRGVEMFRKVDAPILGIVENMSMFICPNCGTRHDIFGHGGARREAARIGVPFLGEIPLELALRETSDAGRPIVVSQPSSAIATAYRDIARRVKAAMG